MEEKQNDAMNEIIKYAGESPSIANVKGDPYQIYQGKTIENDQDRVDILMEYSPNAPPQRTKPFPEGFKMRGLIDWREGSEQKALVMDNLDYICTGDMRSWCGHTLLTKCAGLYNSNSLENVMHLLAAGADPKKANAKSPAMGPTTPMGIAIANGNIPVVNMLLLYGVKIDDVAADGDTYYIHADRKKSTSNGAIIFNLFEALTKDGKQVEDFTPPTQNPKNSDKKKAAAAAAADEAKTIFDEYNANQANFMDEMNKRQEKARNALARRLRNRRGSLKVNNNANIADTMPEVGPFLDIDENKANSDDVIEVTQEQWNKAVNNQKNHSLSVQVEKIMKNTDDNEAKFDLLLQHRRAEAKKRMMERLAARASNSGGRKRRTKKRRKRRTKKRRKKRRKSRKKLNRKKSNKKKQTKNRRKSRKI